MLSCQTHVTSAGSNGRVPEPSKFFTDCVQDSPFSLESEVGVTVLIGRSQADVVVHTVILNRTTSKGAGQIGEHWIKVYNFQVLVMGMVIEKRIVAEVYAWLKIVHAWKEKADGRDGEVIIEDVCFISDVYIICLKVM